MKIKKLLSIILASIMSLGMCSAAFAADEIPEGYTAIYTAEDLKNISDNLSGKYMLMDDINLENETWESIGSVSAPFTGELDGDGHKINNMTSENGLFGYIKNATVKNLGICNFSISRYVIAKCAGAVANQAVNSNIENCYSTGSVFGTTGSGQLALAYDFSCGGLVGYSDGSSFKNCYSSVTQSLEYQVMNLYAGGGLVGEAENSAFDCCYAVSEYTQTFIGQGNTEGLGICTGGLVGYSISDNSFSNCYFNDSSAFAVGLTAGNPESTKSLSDSEMKEQASYAGFDFENVWSMEENGYAVLDFEKIVKEESDSNENDGNQEVGDNNENPETTVELVKAEIVEVPFKNYIVFGNSPKSAEGIKVELTYSDGTVVQEKITMIENDYYVNGELIESAGYTTEVTYGIKSAVYYMNSGEIQLSYKYLALPSIFDFFN